MNSNKVTVIQEGRKVTLICESNGHPIDEVIKLMFKGLSDSGLTQ